MHYGGRRCHINGLLAGMALPLALAGCDSDDSRSSASELTIAESTQPDYLDPALSYSREGWEPMWTVYTPLVTYQHAEGADGSKLIPRLAEALP